MRATEHASRGPFRFLERRHGFAEIVERGALVVVERHCVGKGVYRTCSGGLLALVSYRPLATTPDTYPVDGVCYPCSEQTGIASWRIGRIVNENKT